ncbi:MAG: metallophosphoesterase [Deltaproteobacteria bacterium]|nr:MAG: metallophosphoesterase [Deltaproteobacteria bacterium]
MCSRASDAGGLRVLLLGDSHLGFDHPRRPRVERRRRGPDFVRGLRLALAPALRGEVDLVVHGGDLFHRPNVPSEVVGLGARALLEVTDAGVPVALVPGNHERSRVLEPLLFRHPGLHVFDRPRTCTLGVAGLTVALGGFPYARRVGERFEALVGATGLLAHAADVRLLCVHQAFEGAVVGAHDWVFRPDRDVVAGQKLPPRVAAVLSGHIHRGQLLRRDLAGRPLPCPVAYPGSTERTSFTERFETKGYALLRFAPGPDGGALTDARFVPLPTRPMHTVDVAPGTDADHLRDRLATLAPDAVVRVRFAGPPPLDAATLRGLAPATMNVDLSPRADVS